jgi:integrase
MGRKVREEDIIEREDVIRLIELADTPQKKCLIALMFLSGGRINEVLPIRKRSFQIKELDGIEYLIVRMRILKKRGGKILYRKIPLPLSEQLVPYITNYIEPLKNDDRLFHGWYERKALRLLKSLGRLIGRDVWNHLLRHCRLSELSEELDFDSLDLMRWTGWSDSRPASTYVHSKWKSLAKKLNKK